MGAGDAGNHDKLVYFETNGTIWGLATMKVKDMVLKDAIEERRERDARVTGN